MKRKHSENQKKKIVFIVTQPGTKYGKMNNYIRQSITVNLFNCNCLSVLTQSGVSNLDW